MGKDMKGSAIADVWAGGRADYATQASFGDAVLRCSLLYATTITNSIIADIILFIIH